MRGAGSFEAEVETDGDLLWWLPGLSCESGNQDRDPRRAIQLPGYSCRSGYNGVALGLVGFARGAAQLTARGGQKDGNNIS